jgi:Integrase core domain
MEKVLKRLYVNPSIKTSFSGLSTFERGFKKNKKSKKRYTHKVIKKALEKVDAYTLHRPARKNFIRRRIFIPCLADQYVADLIDISKFASKNDKKKFLLTCMDGFSRFAYVIPIPNKTGDSVLSALTSIFSKVTPRRLQTDQGSEFLCKKVQDYLKGLNIKHFFTGSEVKASLIERFHRTLMQRLARYMTHKGTKRFVDVLPQIVSDYNGTWHSSIKMCPRDVNKSNQVQVFLNLYDKKEIKQGKPPLKIGDVVLISKYKNPFDKGYAQSWKSEQFYVTGIKQTAPYTYELKDMNDQVIFGSFYLEELQKISHS